MVCIDIKGKVKIFKAQPFLHLGIILSMAIHRTRKEKESPHYGFLVSWQPKGGSEAHVKRESEYKANVTSLKTDNPKKADLLAQDGSGTRIKKDIARSLIIVSLILILELVVYLAWTHKVLP